MDISCNHCTHCGDEVPTGRSLLGYTTCLPCGDKVARERKHCVVPMSKSNYVVVTNRDELAWLNPKRIGG